MRVVMILVDLGETRTKVDEGDIFIESAPEVLYMIVILTYVIYRQTCKRPFCNTHYIESETEIASLSHNHIPQNDNRVGWAFSDQTNQTFPSTLIKIGTG